MDGDRDGEEESYIIAEFETLNEAKSGLASYFEIISEEKARKIPYLKSAPNSVVDTTGLFIWPDFSEKSID